jgi:hypothetical protein
MLGILRNRRAQTTAEYAILIGIVVAALVAMQTYVKRGLQAKIQTGVGTEQYEPYYLSSSFNTSSSASETKGFIAGGGATRSDSESSNRVGTQTLGAAPAQ